MIPLNGRNKSCDPISSDCVIWQGPDIPCIELCKGDSVSDVVFKLATELCTIIELVDLTTYDLSCFTPGSKPESFKELIQKIIDNLCLNSGLTGFQQLSGETSAGCPDCLVELAPCLQYQNELGDTIVNLQLTDYVRLIGNRICSILLEIGILTGRVDDLEDRVEILESYFPLPTPTQPQITPVCVITPAVPTDISIVLAALESQFCQLRSATGTPTELFGAIQGNCLPSQPPQALSTSGNIASWQLVQNLSNAMNNIYLMICDLRQAVSTIQLNCCPTGCDGIDVQFQYAYSNPNLTLYFTGTIPAGFIYCGGITPKIKITDGNGSFTYVDVDIIGSINDPGGIVIDLSSTILDVNSNFLLELRPCYFNPETNSTCQYDYCSTIVNQIDCPLLETSSITTTSFDFEVDILTGPIDVTINLYDATGTSLLQSSSNPGVIGPSTISGTFAGLTANTVYKVQIVVVINGVSKTCPWNIVTTSEPESEILP